MILPIGKWVLEQACEQLAQWHKEGFEDMHVAVNLSPRQFGQNDLVADISQALKAHGVEGRHLELELTESTVMHEPDQAIQMFSRLKALGVSLSIDDFGTGYSSLSYLKRLPIDRLKIDRSFIQDLTTHQDSYGIVNAILALARQLNLQVVAEGVETMEQREILTQLGCEELQGFFFSRPRAANELGQYLKRKFAESNESC